MKKKQLFMVLSLFMLYSLNVNVCSVYGEEHINIHHTGNHDDHSGIPFVPADMPDVYYDSDTEEIIIDGPGYATYYDVDIISVSTGYVVLYDTVNGTYGTVDVSSLPDDDYTILITSSNNNEYEGSFTNY